MGDSTASSRRIFLKAGMATAAGVVLPSWTLAKGAPAIIQSETDGFWEFVAGPLNAGSFGPNTLDGTFGPQVVLFKAPPPGRSNLSPLSGLQFFGEVNIDSNNADMTVDLRDIDGASVFSRTLQARMG